MKSTMNQEFIMHLNPGFLWILSQGKRLFVIRLKPGIFVQESEKSEIAM